MALPVSTRYVAALARSHRIAVQGDILDTSGRIVLGDLPITTGSITIDRTASVRRTCTITVAASPEIEAVLPTARRRSPLDPYGNEIALQRGIVYPDGTTEMIPLGVFGVRTSDLKDDKDGRYLEITGVDRSMQIADAKYALTVYSIARGTNLVTAIANLVNDRLPTNVTVIAADTGYTTPLLVLDGNISPWEVITNLGAAAGCEVFFDPLGNLVIQDEPDPTMGEADWSYAEGVDCTILALERSYTVEATYNAVVITGENGQGDVPVIGSAVDSDPASPTYYYGPFGPRPVTESSPLALTSGQATTIAAARLRSLTGLSEKIQLEIIPNPALDVSDILAVRREVIDVDDDLLVESLTLPLDPTTTMSVICRTRRIGSV